MHKMRQKAFIKYEILTKNKVRGFVLQKPCKWQVDSDNTKGIQRG